MDGLRFQTPATTFLDYGILLESVGRHAGHDRICSREVPDFRRNCASCEGRLAITSRFSSRGLARSALSTGLASLSEGDFMPQCFWPCQHVRTTICAPVTSAWLQLDVVPTAPCFDPALGNAWREYPSIKRVIDVLVVPNDQVDHRLDLPVAFEHRQRLTIFCVPDPAQHLVGHDKVRA